MTARWTCQIKDCPLAVSGQCVEDYNPPQKCPNAVIVSADTPSPASKRSVRSRGLPLGEVLDFAAATRILRAEPGQVLLLAGSQRSGKTTLALALYELFQRAPFAGLRFAGSETLVAFERLCHDARVNSNNEDAETLRTELEAGTHFLHLRLRRHDLVTPPINLLFADLSGEHYERACNSTEECKKLNILHRADRIILLIDGERLLKGSEQAKVLKEVNDLLQSALDAQMLGKWSQVFVRFAKWDRLAATPKLQDTLNDIEEILTKSFADRLGRLHFGRLAARPEHRTKEIPLGYGLKEILDDITAVPARPPLDPFVLDAPSSERQADRYLALRLPHLCKKMEVSR